MNTDLIKQLELALAVERGEVPRSEVQAKYLSENKWVDLEDSEPPHKWDYCLYEYRHKPKPREWWSVEYDDGSFWHGFDTEESAKKAMASHVGQCFDSRIPKRAFLSREVTND